MTGLWESMNGGHLIIVEGPWHDLWSCCYVLGEPFIASTKFIEKHFKRTA